MIADRALPRPPAGVRDGLCVVLTALAGAFVLTGIGSLAYRPRAHTGSPLDWLRIAGYLVAMAVGAPLQLHERADRGQLRLVPLTVTALLLVVTVRRGRRAGLTQAPVCAATAGVLVGIVALCTGSRLTSYGRHLRVHASVPVPASAIGAAVVVGVAYAVAARPPTGDGGWARAGTAAVRGTVVIGAVAVLTAVGAALWWGHFPVRVLGAVPALLGDGTSWLGGFSLGARISADLSSPIPFLSGNFGAGMVTGGARPAAYALLVVPLVAAVLAGLRQQRDAAPNEREWAEFGRAVVCNGVIWLLLAEASRLRFSGRLGAGILSGSAGLDPWTTAFVAALWGGVSAVLGLALAPGRETSSAAS